MWKIIKTWLPPKSVEKIKFVDKKSLKDFVSPDQSLMNWGGIDAYEYKFEPELTTVQEPLANGDIDARKVSVSSYLHILYIILPSRSPFRDRL